MDARPDLVIEHLWEQILYWNPKLEENIEQKNIIKKKLQEQLVDGRAEVRVKTLEVEYDELHKSCESKIKELKLILDKANGKTAIVDEDINTDSECKEEDIKVEDWEESGNSDNEQLSVIAKKYQRSKCSNDVVQLPLAVRKTPRKRKKSSNFKYVEMSPVQMSKQVRAKSRGKRPVIYCCEEDADCNRESHHSLHIEIPRLFLQGRRHHLYLGNKLSEETFADMAREAKQRALEKYPICSAQNTKQNQKRKDTVATFCSSSVTNTQQTPEEVEFSQLVRDIMPGDGSEDEETWQAARALECINNNVLDNLDTSMEGFFTFPISAQEAQLCSEPTTSKRRRKSPKPNSRGQGAKRGRKPKNKDSLLVQPPTKSNLAQYVENFSNDCAGTGSATPAASSTMSQPLVSSTTHNFEFIDQQDPGTVMCYIEGDWANGGSCQLVTTNGLPYNDSQMQAQNINGSTLPFQENTLDGNLGLTMSAPLNSYEFSNLTQSSVRQQNTDLQNALAHPIINIQIPTLPITPTTISESAECVGIQPPLPAHIISNCVLDLSVKSKTADTANASIDMAKLSNSSSSNTSLKFSDVIDDNDASIPLDLSLKSASNQSITSTSVTTEMDTALSESHYVVEHNGQYYDFERCLDELQFDRSDKPYKGKDMPLLECNNEHANILMKATSMISSDSTKSLSIDSNYITMNEDKSEIHSSILGEEFQFASESTKEIFHNLFEIDSLNAEDGENITRDNVSFLTLDNETFNCSEILSSTLNISENSTRVQIDDKDKPNDQRINLDTVIKDAIVSYVNITDTCFKSSATVEEIKCGQSKYEEKCEPTMTEGTRDSQLQNLDDVIKDNNIPVKKIFNSSSSVDETTTITGGTRKAVEKFVPRILKRSQISLKNSVPTNYVEQVKENDDKPHENIQKSQEKSSEEPNDKPQEECVNGSKQISETKSISKGNNSVANNDVPQNDTKTGSHILNQCQKSILDTVSEDTDLVVVRDESFCKNISFSVKEITNTKMVMDKCEHMTFNSIDTSLNESHSNQYARKIDKKSHNTIQKSPENMKSTQSESLEDGTKSESVMQTKPISSIVETSLVLNSNTPATKLTSSSKKLDETSIIENFSEKQVIKPKEIDVIESSKKCEKALQLLKADADSQASIGKIVFSVKRVDLSDETNSLDYTFENCESSRKRASQFDSSLKIEDNNTQLLASSNTTKDSTTETCLKDPRKHCITNNAKELIIKTPNEDLKYVSYISSKVSSSQHKLPEGEKQKKDVTVLNLTKTSEKEWKVIDLKDDKNKYKNASTVSSCLSTQNADTENPSVCQVLGTINLEQPRPLSTSDHVQTVKHLEIPSCNDIRNDSQFEGTNIKEHNTNDENKFNSNCLSVVIPKTTTLDLSNMSLLEMESKLEEDNLDFEEDFDDALSLATSSFDSPNENRFMESLVYESDSSANDHDFQTPPNTIINSNAIPKPVTKPSLEDLRNFKIPKLKKFPSAELNKQEGTTKMSITCKDIAHINHFTLQPFVRLEKITMNKEGNNARKENGNVAGSSKVLNPITTEVETITRTIKNENANANATTISGILSHNQEHAQSQQKMLQTIKCIINNNSSVIINQQPPLSTNGGKVVSNQNPQYIYGITCLPHLVDRCLKSAAHCQYSHQLNDNDTVFDSLSSLDNLQLIEAYCFMYNHQKLYKSYFLVFCNLYTVQRDRNKLLCMIIDCERYPQYSEFLIVLYEGLIKCGLSRVNACRHILQRIKERSIEFIDALVAIIMKSDWTMFAEYIESFAQGEYNFRFGTLELMSQAVLHSNNEHLKQVFGKCVQMLHSDDTALLVTSPNVIQWVNLFIKP